jgi:uncharacterized glyoxalase superfamily protein PhnB
MAKSVKKPPLTRNFGESTAYSTIFSSIAGNRAAGKNSAMPVGYGAHHASLARKLQTEPKMERQMSDTIPQADSPAAAKVLGGMTPYITVDGALKAAEFYKKAFGAETVYSVPPDEQGRTMHVHLHVNGSTLMLSDGFPEHGHPAQTPQGYTLQLHLDDARIDQWWQRAVDAGCEITNPLQVMFWGDRWGSLRDPFGVDWAMNAPLKPA